MKFRNYNWIGEKSFFEPMWFAGTNGFSTVFVFDMQKPVYLPFEHYKALLSSDAQLYVTLDGHCKVKIYRQGDTIVHISGPEGAGPKTTTLSGFTAPSKEDAVTKLSTLLVA